MSFQIIKAEDRVASMIDWFTGICSEITDFVVGSKIRTKFETIAVEMEAQDFAWYQALKKAIPIALYQAFDFGLRPAQKATGEVTFTLSAPSANTTIIPIGTKVSTGVSATNTEIVFQTTAEAVIPAGNISVTTLVASIQTGSANNVAIDGITTLKDIISGAQISVNNYLPIENGLDRETENERRLRFIEYVASLSRGTIKAVEFGAKTAFIADGQGQVVESVQDAVIYEPFLTDSTKPVGVFECYIYNGSGNTTEELRLAAEDVINGHYDVSGNPVAGWKAAGVICNVLKATETAMAVTASLTLLPGYDAGELEAAVEEVSASYISGLGIGREFIYNELVERIMGIQGVYNVSITQPATDHTPSYNEVYIPGTIAVTVIKP